MHILDMGAIPLEQCIIYYIIILIAGYFAVDWVKNNLKDKQIPFIAVISAGVLAIQTLNIPLFAGASGHMVGAALVAIIFRSPYAGFIVLTVVLIIQAILRGDGGFTTLGVNIFNMGLLGSFIGFYSFKGLKSILSKFKQIKPLLAENISVFIACFLSLFIVSLVVAIELWIGGTFPLIEGLLLMGSFHFFAGLIGEGLISTIIYSTIKKVRPDLLSLNENTSNGKTKNLLIIGVIIAIVIAILAVFVASSDPDGLERTLELIDPNNVGEQSFTGIFPDYMTEILGEKLFEIVASVIGVIIAFLVVLGIMNLIKKRKN